MFLFFVLSGFSKRSSYYKKHTFRKNEAMLVPLRLCTQYQYFLFLQCRGLNKGPCTCQASTLILSYTPTKLAHSYHCSPCWREIPLVCMYYKYILYLTYSLFLIPLLLAISNQILNQLKSTQLFVPNKSINSIHMEDIVFRAVFQSLLTIIVCGCCMYKGRHDI